MRVRALESRGECLTKGKEYEVICTGIGGGDELIYYVMSDNGNKQGFFVRRFEKVEGEKPGPRKPKPVIPPEIWATPIKGMDYMAAVRAMCGESQSNKEGKDE